MVLSTKDKQRIIKNKRSDIRVSIKYVRIWTRSILRELNKAIPDMGYIKEKIIKIESVAEDVIEDRQKIRICS